MTEENSIVFKVKKVTLKNGSFLVLKPELSKMKVFPADSIQKTELLTQKARGAYIALISRPDPTYGTAQKLQALDPNLTVAKKKS